MSAIRPAREHMITIDRDIPLVVDLDGTLALTDTLHESLAKFLFSDPRAALASLILMARGRAAFKRFVARRAMPEPTTLPYRTDLIEFIKSETQSGRAVHLVTAADQQIADQVASNLGLFASATGSNGEHNLKGVNKLAFLREQFPKGFIYAGDARADIPLFQAAQGAILCDAKSSVGSTAAALGIPIIARFDRPARMLSAWRRALRVHQWAKNLLIFVALFVGHAFYDPKNIAAVMVGFVALCALSSATYIINDIADIEADRAHPTKRRRPFASGDLPISHGLIVATLLMLGALVGAYALSIPFLLTLLTYLILTTAYSFRFKRIPLCDVFAIGVLFTLRIVMGAALANLGHSPWLLSFALAFFLSLALAKRHAEVMSAVERRVDEIAGRGYGANDWPITLTFGVGAGLVSIVIMLLYMTNDAAPSGFYHQPGWLYAIPALLTLWLMRIWLLANRTQMHDDPVVFALKDKVSYVLGLLVGIVFALAN